MTRKQEKEIERFHQLFEYDSLYTQGGKLLVAGIDEAGRGCLAGPVAAAAVILPPNPYLPGVDDSKVISEKKRERLTAEIKQQALAWSVSLVSQSYIDEHNILLAARAAMEQALLSLCPFPALALIDAMRLNDINIEQISLVKGDSTSLCIACASILAKTERDQVMRNYAQLFPAYGFEQHKGYGTRHHIDCIKAAGSCRLHRMSFEPLKTWTCGGEPGEFPTDNI